MLMESYSPMDCTTFRVLHDDTNAVETHHRFAKGCCIEPLSVAMMCISKIWLLAYSTLQNNMVCQFSFDCENCTNRLFSKHLARWLRVYKMM